MLVLALAGCTDLIGPSPGEPTPDVRDVAAPAVADSLWQSLAGCALVEPAIRLHELRWHRVEADSFTCGHYLTRAVGCWASPADIYLVRWVYDEPWWHAARHEMLHAWLGVGHANHADPSFGTCAETPRPRK